MQRTTLSSGQKRTGSGQEEDKKKRNMEVFNIFLMPLTLHFDTACHTVRDGIQSMLGITYFYGVFP